MNERPVPLTDRTEDFTGKLPEEENMPDKDNIHDSGYDDHGSYGNGSHRDMSHHAKRGHGKDENFQDWWEDRSLPEKVVVGIGFAILGIGLAALFGWIVMALWNWLMPEIFGLKHIDYWQAWGLFLLCTILFKGFGSSDSGPRNDRKRRRHLRRYMREGMPPAEKTPEDPPQT